jgi:uncharacterized protein YbcI
MAIEEHETTGGASPASLISTGLVRLFAKYAGRGPTNARTTIGRDHVLVLLRDTLTKHERTITEAGKEEIVLEGRQTLQGALKDEAISLVEEATARKVIAFLSMNHLDPDVGAELFVLEAPNDGGPPQLVEESEAEA